MKARFDEVLGRALAAWVDRARRHAAVAVGASIALAALSLLYVAESLGVNGDTSEMIAADVPFKRHLADFREAFPHSDDQIFVMVEGPTPELARGAAERLASRLKSQPHRFEHVQLAGGGPFFDRHGLLYLEPEELYDLADHLAEAQPYLAELARDTSLRRLFTLLAEGARAASEGESTLFDLAPVFDRMREVVEAQSAGRHRPLSWQEVLLGGDAGDGETRVLQVQPVRDPDLLQPAAPALDALHGTIARMGSERDGVRIRVTGDPALESEEIAVVRGEAAQAGLISLVLVAVLLALALRSGRLVLATILTLIVGLLLTAAFATAAIGYLNPISVAFAVLFIGLGVDFGLHLCIRYRELRSLGTEHGEALRETARGVGGSLALCAVTTAIGFYAFVPTSFHGVAELGLIAGTGMLISLACSLTLLPALLSLSPVRVDARAPRAPGRVGSALLSVPVRHGRAVCTAAVLIGLASLALIPKVRFDSNPLHLRVQSSEAVQTFNDLLEREKGRPWAVNVLAEDRSSADALAARLRALPAVERTVTLSDYVPEQQERKLSILQDIALFLGPIGALVEESGPRPGFEQQVASLRRFEAAVGELLSAGGDPELLGSARRLRDAVARFRENLSSTPTGRARVAELERALLASLPEQLRRLELSLHTGRVELEDLPDDVVQSSIGRDGRYRVQVFPREDLDEEAEMARFVDSVLATAPDAAGGAISVLQSGRAVVDAFQQALALALVVIAVLLLVLWRRFFDAGLVLGPLLLAATLTAAASVLLHIPFNFADVIVLPLLLGIGVDSGIHLVHRFRVAAPDHGNLLRTSTARAVFFSSVTTMASFGTLGLSAHPGMASLGRLLAVGVALTLLCNLIVLPSMLAPRRSRASGS